MKTLCFELRSLLAGILIRWALACYPDGDEKISFCLALVEHGQRVVPRLAREVEAARARVRI
jgi:hypothetical protein